MLVNRRLVLCCVVLCLLEPETESAFQEEMSFGLALKGCLATLQPMRPTLLHETTTFGLIEGKPTDRKDNILYSLTATFTS